MKSLLQWSGLYAGLLSVAWLAGCGSSASTDSQPTVERRESDHDHHQGSPAGHHAHGNAKSLGDALAKVERLRNAIQVAFAAKDLATADGPVHEIGHLLEELPELAAKESLSAKDQQQVKQSVDSLMKSFAALDERVHGGDGAGKSYDDVAGQIDSALTQLKSVGKETSQ
jgi:hypothetical protein